MSTLTLATHAPAAAAPASLVRKTRVKFFIRRLLGEPYVGKRIKMRHLASILRTLDLPPAPRVLDVGCEDGTFTEWLSRRIPGSCVDGLDLDGEQAAACDAWARTTGRSARLCFRQGSVADLDAIEGYDLVTCLDVLGYIPDDRRTVSRMAAALRPGGWLVIHQPNVAYRTCGGTVHVVTPEQAGLITAGHIRHGYSPEEFLALVASEPSLRLERLHLLNGPVSDVAHRVYRLLERPAPFRLLSLPLVDLLSALDRSRTVSHGNTLCVVARKRGGEPAA